MFNGIITHQGIIKGIQARGENREIVIAAPRFSLRRGESAAVNGVCVTVIRLFRGRAAFMVMPETLRTTTLRYLHKGDRVNIELPLRYGQRISGHFILGHIDTVGKVWSIKKSARGIVLQVSFPARFQRYVTRKGAVALDGVSVTIIKASRNLFSVALIPYTIQHTSLGALSPGRLINIEFDIYARYVHAASY